MPLASLLRRVLVGAVLISGPIAALPTKAQTVVGLAQLPSSDVGKFDAMRALAQQAKDQGATLIIFPEGSVFGWLNPAVFTQAAPIPGRYSDQFAEIARSVGIWVAAGLAEQGPKAGPGSLPNAYQAYDSGILIDPQGQIVLHHRKYNVLQNAFDPAACQAILNQPGCAYTPGALSDIKTVSTPFGKTSLLICADAYTYGQAEALAALKALKPDFVIVPWGITASQQSECGTPNFNATGYAAQAAAYLKSAFVVGANATGPRTYGRFLPSVYCGDSGYANPAGDSVETSTPTQALVLLTVPKSFDAKAGPIWNNGDAQNKCPTTCSSYASAWNGQWTTTVPGQMSVCGCVPSGAD